MLGYYTTKFHDCVIQLSRLEEVGGFWFFGVSKKLIQKGEPY